MMCPPLPWGGWDGCGPTVEGRAVSSVQTPFESSIQNPRQLQYSIAITNIQHHRHHVHDRLTTIGYRVSPGPWVTAPSETRIAPLLRYAGRRAAALRSPARGSDRRGGEGSGRDTRSAMCTANLPNLPSDPVREWVQPPAHTLPVP